MHLPELSSNQKSVHYFPQSMQDFVAEHVMRAVQDFLSL